MHYGNDGLASESVVLVVSTSQVAESLATESPNSESAPSISSRPPLVFPQEVIPINNPQASTMLNGFMFDFFFSLTYGHVVMRPTVTGRVHLNALRFKGSTIRFAVGLRFFKHLSTPIVSLCEKVNNKHDMAIKKENASLTAGSEKLRDKKDDSLIRVRHNLKEKGQQKSYEAGIDPQDEQLNTVPERGHALRDATKPKDNKYTKR